jgi:ubiquinol-cytochrome c reductase cytochrome b subunit
LSARSSAAEWLELRTGLPSLVRERLGAVRVPARRDGWLVLGGVLVLAFAVQIASGLLLLAYYAPDPGQAFDSVRQIRREVPFGWLVQLVHSHGANLMLAVLFAHLLHGAIAGTYKKPRELHWITGCGLLLLVFAAALTGYILPWSQLSYWGTTVVTASIEYVPVVGPGLMRWLRGGDLVGPATFRRAFAAHAVAIPLAMVALVWLHGALLRRTGLAGPLRRRGASEPVPRSIPLFPDVALRYAIAGVTFLLVLVALVVLAPGLFSPPQSFLPADPLDTPAHIKPEWYFLWQYELPRLVPERLGLAIQGLALMALVGLPFLDRSPDRHPADRPWIMTGLAVAVAGWIALGVMGHLA